LFHHVEILSRLVAEYGEKKKKIKVFVPAATRHRHRAWSFMQAAAIYLANNRDATAGSDSDTAAP
jgi:RNA-splicing ligase RtcB